MSELEDGIRGMLGMIEVQRAEIEMLRSKVSEACNIIRWFRENDETNQGDIPLTEHGGQTWDQLNAYWIEGLNRASKFLIENDKVELPS